MHLSDTREKNGSIMEEHISYLKIMRRLMTQSREKYCTIFSLHLIHLWN